MTNEDHVIGGSPALFDAMGGAILGSAVGALISVAENFRAAEFGGTALRIAGIMILIFAGILIVRLGRLTQKVSEDFNFLWAVVLEERKKELITEELVVIAKANTWKKVWDKRIRHFRANVLIVLMLILVACVCFGLASQQLPAPVNDTLSHPSSTPHESKAGDSRTTQ